MEFLHLAMWHDHDIDFSRWLHPAMRHVALESWQWIHQVATPSNVIRMWRISAILDFMGPIMGSLKSPCTTSYIGRQSIQTIALNCLVFWENGVFLYFGDIWTYRQTDRQTDEQTDSIDALSRSRCRERRLNKARYWSKNANFSYLLVGLFNLHDFIVLLWIFAQNINTNCSSSWTIRRCKNIAEKFKSLVQQRFRQTGDRRTARAIARSLTSIFAVMLVASQCAVDTTHTWVDAAIRSPRTVITDSQGYF